MQRELMTGRYNAVHREPMSIARTSRVAVPTQTRLPSQSPANQTDRRSTIQKPINTYTQPNPWPPELVLEYDNYKAADRTHGAASSRYRRERRRREAEVTALKRTTGRQTFTPMKLTPESHFELRPMAVDWRDTAQTLVLADWNSRLGVRKC